MPHLVPCISVGPTKFETMRDDLQALLNYADFSKHVIPFPSWMVIPVLKIIEYLHLSRLYQWFYETAGKDHHVSVDKLRKEFGWNPQKTTADVWINNIDGM